MSLFKDNNIFIISLSFELNSYFSFPYPSVPNSSNLQPFSSILKAFSPAISIPLRVIVRHVLIYNVLSTILHRELIFFTKYKILSLPVASIMSLKFISFSSSLVILLLFTANNCLKLPYFFQVLDEFLIISC